MSFSELSIKISAHTAGAIEKIGAFQRKIEGLTKASKGFTASGAQMAVAGAGIAAAGAGIGYGLYKAVAAYGALQDAQQHLLTALPAGVAGMDQMRQATEMARQASLRFNVSQEDVLENVYLGISAGLNFHQAMTNALSSVETAKGTQGDIAETGRTMAQVVKLFGDASLKGAAAAAQIQHFNDVVSYGVRMKAFRNVGELNIALSESIGSAKAARVSFNDLLATLAGFQQAGLVGSQAGVAFTEALNAMGRQKAFAKLGVQVATFKNGAVDVLATIANIKESLAKRIITPEQFALISKALGIRGARLLAVDAADLRKAREEFSTSAVNGAALQGANLVMASMNEQIGRALQGFHQLEIAIGVQLAPTITSLASGFASFAASALKFAQAHPALVKFVALFAAISAGVLIVVGGLLAVAGAVAAGVAAFAALGIAGPIVAGIVAVGIAIAAVVSAVAAFAPQFFKAGYNIAKSIAAGILSGIEHPLAAIGKVVKMIRDHLPFSPAKIGPLKDLGRVRISETIAAAIRPMPVMRAMGSVAAGIAMTGAMMGTPAYAANSAAPVTINISMPLRVGDVYNGDGFKQALREHRTDLYEVLERELSKRSRTDY